MMQVTVEPVARLIEQFARLPGIGPKTAQRLTFFLLRSSEQVAADLAEAIREVKENVRFCSICMNITDVEPWLSSPRALGVLVDVAEVTGRRIVADR